MVRVAIIGASGYTGAEAIKIILGHSEAELTYLTALPEECGPVETVFPQFKGRCGMEIEPLDMEEIGGVADVVLCCLPHKVSMGFVPKLLGAGLKVIDFSADYRLRDPQVYETFYQEHTDKANLANAVYGLPELFRDEIAGADLIANPGCFPTGAVLAIAPLLKEGLIEPDSIIVNALTGSSGAGKNPSVKFHFPNMNENVFPYGIGVHRHMPEIEQVASDVAGCNVKVLFQPHAGPFDRGILSTVYCRPSREIGNEKLLKLYDDFYRREQFVRVRTDAPGVKDVVGTNYCHVFAAAVKGRIVAFSAIDNINKGASGQAIQNMNILFGLDETEGLK
ncbi:MAG: N-acetyl-gamma-glutamyl-phosphate reductase [Sedimentisphaerales bacterium]|nr:N-acetyl-gamma-glutamyl-phosphate reductase [Sedimentisphaerales bacterium]